MTRISNFNRICDAMVQISSFKDMKMNIQNNIYQAFVLYSVTVYDVRCTVYNIGVGYEYVYMMLEVPSEGKDYYYWEC